MQGFMAATAMYSVMFILLSLCKFKELHIGFNIFPARLKVIYVEIPEGHDPLEAALQLRLLIPIHQMLQGLQISFFNAPVRRLHPLINRRSMGLHPFKGRPLSGPVVPEEDFKEILLRQISREALIKSLSDFILVFLFNARNQSTRIASYLRRLMTPHWIKIHMKFDSAN